MIEVLGCLWDSRFSLHGFLQSADRGVRGNFQREEVGIFVRGSGNIERDAPSKVGRSVKVSSKDGVKVCTNMMQEMRRVEVN
jgi:hypothetical protein